MLALVRWLKLFVYLLIVYVVLSVAMPRAGVWLSLVRGPAGWVPEPPHPVLWPVLTVLTGVFVLVLVLDVGFGLVKVPNGLSALMLVCFGLSVFGYLVEDSGRLKWRAEPYTLVPGAQAGIALDVLGTGLADYYRHSQSFPGSGRPLQDMLLSSESSAKAPYVYRWLRRRPFQVRVELEAPGPRLSVRDGEVPGTIIYSVSEDGQSYWLTAIVGHGAPATAVLLTEPGGRPVVVSNDPEAIEHRFRPFTNPAF